MKDLYAVLAPFYDSFNGELDYGSWADFLEENFRRYYDGNVASVLDLGCGTGRMTLELAKRGYDMTGIDSSPQMLSVARDAAEKAGLDRQILFLQQDMCEFELYGTVEAIVCCLDTVNHVTDRAALSRCFHWVHNYLVPGGLFLFDVNSPYKFREVYGDRAYLLEAENVFCAWQNLYRPRSGICDFYLSLFSRGEDGRYDRTDVYRRERLYTLAALRRLLRENRMELLAVTSGYGDFPPAPESERYYLTARAIKEENI